MNKTNVLFLTEYKKLDDLCKDVLDTEEGINAYIREMELCVGPKKNIDQWVDDYHNLNKCRHIGNLLERYEATGREPQCTKQDIAWLKKFQQKLAGGADPVEEVRKYHESLELKEEKRKHFQPYFEKAAKCAVLIFILLLALADSKNKKKIEEQMKLKQPKAKKEKKKKKAEEIAED